jgi:hypothetical protein
MRRSALLFTLLSFAAGPVALAQDNTITVIGDDGKKVTIELEDPDYVLPGEPPPAPQPPPSEPEPVPEQEVESVPAVEAAPFVDEIVAPEGKRPAPAPEPAPKETKSEKPAKKEKLKHPKPPPVPQQKAVQQQLEPGREISERMASSIAFDRAPPSSDFTTTRQSYEGKPVYVVTFATESGPYDVVVEAATGAIVAEGYVETHVETAPAPGHLPQSWKPYDPQPVGSGGRTITRGNIPSEDN